ncbi:MAG: hypothetical protein U0R76_00235 [Candidatus Nanopelagicales bacterium]
MTALEQALRSALVPAMRAKDEAAVSALRSALSAVANGQAVDVRDVDLRGTEQSEHVAGALVGVGAAEVERRTLSEGDARSIVEAERWSRESDASTYEQHGQPERAARLRAEADVLAGVLRGITPEGGS